MKFRLIPVDAADIDDKARIKESIRARQPFVIKGFARHWPAMERWSLEYMRQVAGGRPVPVYDNAKTMATHKVNQPLMTLPFREYLDIIEQGPTQLRIFAFNILKEAPRLNEEFLWTDLGLTYLKKYPLMFFGGEGSDVFLHYDYDMSHVITTQFHGRKRVILFAPEYSRYLYKIPFAVHSLEDIDFNDPDLEKYPALAKAEGKICYLNHGDTLFMPSGWWHYMKYLEGGFALSLRALDRNFGRKMQGLYNVTLMRQFDNLARRVGGQKWLDMKDRMAYRRSNMNA